MNILMIFPYYIYWHYARGTRGLVDICINIIVFEFHYFSVKELVKTLFAPYHRLKENYNNGSLDIELALSTFVTNVIMRIIGLCIRLSILGLASISLLVSLILAPVLVILWLVIPFVLIVSIVFSLLSLFR